MDPKKAVKPEDGVIERKRKIVFEGGQHLNLRNVRSFNSQGTYLRLKSDEGYILVNPDKVLYHIVDAVEIVS